MEQEVLWRLLADIFEAEPERLTGDTRFSEDLLADALDLQELSLALEEELGLALPVRELTDRLDTLTVGDVLALIRGRGRET